MRFFFKIFFFLLILFGCTHSKKKENEIIFRKKPKTDISSDTCGNYDRILLKFANNFKPKEICLDESISPELRHFITSIDPVCLRKQKEYKFFITYILAKQYVYHVTKLEVGTNLLSMKVGAAKIIINELQLLTGYQNSREFFNSGMVIDFIRKDSLLRRNKKLQYLIKDIH